MVWDAKEIGVVLGPTFLTITGDCGLRPGFLLLKQAEFLGVTAAEEEVEEGIGGGTPILPALRPVGAAAIAGVIAEDGDGAGLFLPRLGIEDKLSPALRHGRKIFRSGFCGLVWGIHLKAGLETK